MADGINYFKFFFCDSVPRNQLVGFTKCFGGFHRGYHLVQIFNG